VRHEVPQAWGANNESRQHLACATHFSPTAAATTTTTFSTATSASINLVCVLLAQARQRKNEAFLLARRLL